MQALYFVPILGAMDFSKCIKIYPQLWGEGSLPRMPLEGKVRWRGGVGGGVDRFLRFPRRGRGALLRGTGALTWPLQGAGVGVAGGKGAPSPPPPNAQNRETRQERGMAASDGKPAPSGPHPVSSPEPRAAFSGSRAWGVLQPPRPPPTQAAGGGAQSRA